MKATFDPSVIDRWARRLAFARRLKIVSKWAVAMAVCVAIVLLMLGAILSALIVFLLAISLMVMILLVGANIACPHCGNYPVAPRTSIGRLELCNYCHHWLRDPDRREQPF